MASPFNLRRFLARLVFRVLLLAVVAICGFGFYLHQRGMPEWLLQATLRRVNRDGPFVVAARSIGLDGWRGLVIHDMRLYRKRVIGPPALEAGEVVAEIDVAKLMDGNACLRGIRVRNGRLRPECLAEPAASSAARPPRPASYVALETALELDHCEVFGLTVRSLVCGLTVRGASWKADRLQGVLESGELRGELRGNIAYDAVEGFLDGRLDSTLDPHLVAPLIRACKLDFLESLLQRFEFSDPPVCNSTFRNTFGPGGSLAVDTRFAVSDMAYRGVPVSRADGHVTVSWTATNRVVTVEPIFVVRPEGSAKGGFSVDASNSLVRFDGVSSLDPVALLDMVGLLTNVCRDVCRFAGPVRVQGVGVVDYATLDRTVLDATVRGQAASLAGYQADDCSFAVEMRGRSVALRDVRASAYGGSVEGVARFALPTGLSTDTTYTIEGKLTDAAFPRVADALVGRPLDAGLTGRFSGWAKVSGVLGDGRSGTVTGQGGVTVKDGRVFSMPVFGGLSRFMTRLIPGLDFVLRQSDASADFAIGGSKLHTDRLSIEGEVLSLVGKGDYRFDGNLEYSAQVTVMREHSLVSHLLRALTYPISKLFEFRVKGSRDNPEWYPVNFSSDLLDRIGFSGRIDGTKAP